MLTCPAKSSRAGSRFWLLLALLSVCSTRAHAEQSAADPTTERARSLYIEGVEAYKAREYEKARAAFVEAYQLKPDSLEVLRNLGAAEVRSGHVLDGARHLSRWLRESGKATEEERVATRELLAEAEAQLGRVRIAVDEAGVNIRIDGELVGVSPIEHDVHVTPGVHALLATKDHRQATDRFDVKAGTIAHVSPSFDETAQVSRPLSGTTPAQQLSKHKRPSKAAPSGREAEHQSRLYEFERTSTALVVGGWLTLAALGTGWAFTNARTDAEDYAEEYGRYFTERFPGASVCSSEDRPSDCSVLASTAERAVAYRSAATASYVIAGLAAAGTLAYVIAWPRPQRPRVRTTGWARLIAAGQAGGAAITGMAFALGAGYRAERVQALKNDVGPSMNPCRRGQAPYVEACDELHEARIERDLFRRIEIVSFGMAAVGLASALTYTLLEPSATAVSLRATAAPISGGQLMLVRGEF